MVERNIAENVKLRKRRIAEIKKEEKNINCKLFNEYFINQQSPSDMYKKLRKTEGEWSEKRVFLIREVLNKMKKVIENVPGDRKFKIEENEKINNIVERILYFNQLNQSGKGLKILIPKPNAYQITNFFSIIKSMKIILKNLKSKLDNYCIICTYQKN